MLSGDCMRKNSKDKYIGQMYKSNRGDIAEIVKYNSGHEVTVRFLNTGFEVTTQLINIQEGRFSDKSVKTIYGVASLGYVKDLIKDATYDKLYSVWSSMVRRCYKTNSNIKNKSYEICDVGNYFLVFRNFYDWAILQKGCALDGWCLDKDILSKGNKTYSELNCVFVPFEINNSLIARKSERGNFPMGVSWHKRDCVFAANISVYGNRKHLGYFETENEAFKAYKQAKESYLKGLANKWKGQIDDRAYNALMNYEVEITD